MEQEELNFDGIVGLDPDDYDYDFGDDEEEENDDDTPLKFTDNFYWLLEHKDEETIALEGSMRSSKTISIMQFLILKALNQLGAFCASLEEREPTEEELRIAKEDKPIDIRIGRLDGARHQDTTIPDLKFLLMNQFVFANGSIMWDDKNWNKSEKRYTFDNGSIIHFVGLNDEGKVHGLAQDIFFFNEIMEIPKAVYEQIIGRTRSQVFIDWNPSDPDHWLFPMLNDDDIAYKHSTYKDNRFLTKRQVKTIESWEPTPFNIKRGTANEWQWDVYGRGKRGSRKGSVYKNWKICEKMPPEHICKKYGYGLDFGFSMDPCAMVKCGIYNDILYLDEVIYEDQLPIVKSVSSPNSPSLELRMEDSHVSKDLKIYADCARPEAIQALFNAGYNIVKCRKGPDSLLDGIQLLQSLKIRVTRRSSNVIRELGAYCWDQKSDGTYIGRPKDKFDHAMDAIRYWAMDEVKALKNEFDDRYNDEWDDDIRVGESNLYKW